MGLFWGTSTSFSRGGSFLKAREQTAAGGPEVAGLASCTWSRARPGKAWLQKGGGWSGLAGFPPVTPCRGVRDALQGVPSSLSLFSGDDTRPLAHLWAGEPRIKGLTQCTSDPSRGVFGEEPRVN